MEKEKLITKSIILSFINDDKKIFNKEVEFSSICALELEDISTTIGHTAKGEFLEFLTCKYLNLRLYKDKIEKSVLEALNKSILSIELKFDNDTSISYNLSWNSNDGITNLLQSIIEEKGIIKVFVG